MKREVLFRGKRIDNGEWVYGDLMHWNSLGLTAITPQEGDQWTSPSNFKVDPDTVGQFTGLTDKNVNKTFEGDIVKIDITDVCGHHVSNHEVYFDAETLRFDLRYDNVSVFNCQFSNDFEVIGNIHDNPELL